MTARRETGDARRDEEGFAARRSAIRRMTDGLTSAFRFLTILPVPPPAGSEREAISRAATFYPVAGVAVGAPAALILAAPVPPLLGAAFALAAGVVVTGGLHEDGWMDVMDAAFAPVDRTGRLEVLGDPRVGAHGVTGGVLMLLVRFAALATVSPTAALTAPVLGRWTMALSLAWAPPARARGLGAVFAAHPRPVSASVLAVAILAALALAGGPVPVAMATLAAAFAALGSARFLVGRLGGLNGDGHGAVGLAAEVASLCAFVPFAGGWA